MRKVKGVELTERQRYWLDQIEACAAAGKTIAEYATCQTSTFTRSTRKSQPVDLVRLTLGHY
jgi:hypothetical protein